MTATKNDCLLKMYLLISICPSFSLMFYERLKSPGRPPLQRHHLCLLWPMAEKAWTSNCVQRCQCRRRHIPP